MLTQLVGTTSEGGRLLDVYVAIGLREEYYTELLLLGHCAYKGEHYVLRGSTSIREGRSDPEAELYRGDTGERISDEVAADIVSALFAALDERGDSILAQEMARICG